MRARRVARAAVLMGVGAAAVTHHQHKKEQQQLRKEHQWMTALNSSLSARAKHHHAPVVFVVCWKKKELAHAQLNVSKTDLIFDQELAHTKKYSFHIIYVRNNPPKGIYKIAVDFKGQCFHDCKKSKPIVSVWDFRRQEMGLFHVTQDRPTVRIADFRALNPLDNHLPVNNWVIGSFVVDGSLFGWHAKFNTVTTGFPSDWSQTPTINITTVLNDDAFDDSDSDDDDDCKMVISEFVQPQVIVVQNPPPVNPQSVPQPYYPPPQVPYGQVPQQTNQPVPYPQQPYPYQYQGQPQAYPQQGQAYPPQAQPYPQQYQVPPQPYAPQGQPQYPVQQGNPYAPQPQPYAAHQTYPQQTSQQPYYPTPNTQPH